ncbi:MAG: phospholipase D-like domain-containing protein [Candidatus Lokiarchaeota archaeon]
MPNISYGNNNWKTFQKLLQKAERNIKIITASISFKALDLITSSINKNVEIFILTGRGRNYERIIEIENIKRKNIKGCRGLHSKYAIIDDNIIVIGSSNITKRSLGDIKYEGEFEIDYITDDPVVIRKANQLFEIVWNENENTEK